VGFLPLVLGALATLNPLIGLILMMIYSGVSLRYSISNPLNAMALFFVAPALLALAFRSEQTLIVSASDAVWGVGFASIIFLLALRNQRSLSASFTLAAISIIIYGILRHLVFGKFLTLQSEQAMAELNRLLPQLYERPEMRNSLALMRQILPASWILPQLTALFLGFLLFMLLNGIPFIWSRLSFPKYYNLLILLVLPLYLVPLLKPVFLNLLIALSLIPFIQGIGVLVHYLSRLIPSKLIMVLLIILLSLNGILIALLGFADLWLDLRKLNNGGTTA